MVARREPSSFASAILALGVAGTALSLASLVAVYATYEGREQRELTRLPVLAQQGDEPHLLWVSSGSSVQGLSFSVVYIEPLAPEAPLPPGLSTWPQPGEFLASPQLLAMSAERELEARYGNLAGTIAPDGLVSPTEMLAYVRPQAGAAPQTRTLRVSGFGVEAVHPGVGAIGETLRVEPIGKFYTLIVPFLILPALLVIPIIANVRHRARRRRSSILEAIGLRARERMLIDVATYAAPLMVGALIAVLVVAIACATDIPLEGAGYVLQARDMREQVAWLAVAVIAGVLLNIIALAFAGRAGRGTSATRPAPVEMAPSPVLAAVSLFAAPAATFAVIIIHRAGGADWAVILYLIALAATLATLRHLVGWATHRAGRRLRTLGEEARSPGALLAGATLSREQKSIVRFASVIAASIIIASQAQAYSSLMGQATQDELAVRNALNGRYAQFTVPTEDLTLLAAALAAVDGVSNPSVIVLDSSTENPETGPTVNEIWGDTDALRAWGLHTPTGTLADLDLPVNDRLALNRLLPEQEDLLMVPQRFDPSQTSSSTFRSIAVLLKSTDGSPLPLDALKYAISSAVFPEFGISEPGESEYVGSHDGRHQARWIGWFATLGSLILVLGMTGSASDDIARSARKVTPLAALMAAHRELRWFAALRVGVPSGVGIALGITLSLMLTSPLSIFGGVPTPVSAVAGTAIAALLGAVALWGSLSVSINRYSREWGEKVRKRW